MEQILTSTATLLPGEAQLDITNKMQSDNKSNTLLGQLRIGTCTNGQSQASYKIIK